MDTNQLPMKASRSRSRSRRKKHHPSTNTNKFKNKIDRSVMPSTPLNPQPNHDPIQNSNSSHSRSRSLIRTRNDQAKTVNNPIPRKKVNGTPRVKGGDMIHQIAYQKAESTPLPAGILSSKQLFWYKRPQDKLYFPCRKCDIAEAREMNLEPHWDPSEVTLVQSLEFPLGTKPFDGRDRMLVDNLDLRPYGNSHYWDPKIHRTYVQQRTTRLKKVLTPSDAKAGYFYLQRILRAAILREAPSSPTTHHPHHENHNNSDDDESSTSSLEIPYADPISQSSGQLPLPDFSQTNKEKLRPGDVIEYCHPIYCAGDPRGMHTAIVLKTNPSAERGPLTLDSGDVLPPDHRVKRIKIFEEGRLRKHKSKYRSITSFRMKKRGLPKSELRKIKTMADKMNDIMDKNLAKLKHNIAKVGGPVDLVGFGPRAKKVPQNRPKSPSSYQIPEDTSSSEDDSIVFPTSKTLYFSQLDDGFSQEIARNPRKNTPLPEQKHTIQNRKLTSSRLKKETLRESKDRKSDLSSSSDSTFTKGGNTSKNILSRNQKRYKHSTLLSDDSEGDSDDDIDLSFRPFERNKQKQSKIRSPKICHPKKQSPVTVQNLRPHEDVQKKQQRSLVACRKINQNTNKKDNQVVLTKAGLDPIDSLIVRKASKSGLIKLKQTMESAVTDLSDEEVYNTLSEDDSHFGVSVQGHSTAQPIKIQSDDEDLGKDVGLSSDSKRRQGHHENLQEDARAFGFTKTNSKIHVSSERKSKERPPTSPDGTRPAHESSVKKRIISIFEKHSSMCDDEFSDYSARIVGLVPSEQQRRMSSISEKEGSSDWMSSTPDTSGRRNGKHVKPSEIRVFEFSNPFLASGSSKETLRCSTALNTSSLKEIRPKDNGSFASIDHNVDENRSFRSASNNIVREKNGRRPSMLSDGSSECGNVQYRSHPKSIFAGTSKEADDLEESSDNESFKDILNIKYGSKKSKGLGRSYSGLDGQLNIKFTAESRQSSRVKSVSKH